MFSVLSISRISLLHWFLICTLDRFLRFFYIPEYIVKLPKNSSVQ